MAGEVVYKLRHAKHPTVAIAGVTHAGIDIQTSSARDPGDAGAPGTEETQLTDRRILVTLYGKELAALTALLGAAAANLVLGYTGAAGANEKLTLKNVAFTEVGQGLALPAKDAGGNAPVAAVRGEAEWGVSDTFALMIVAAADT